MAGNRFVFSILPVLLVVGQAPAEPPARYEFDEPHMGTQFRITLYAADRPAAVTAARAAFKRVRELEMVLSDYRADSETMKLCKANDADPGKPRPVSDDLAAVLTAALDVSAKSDGAFDVTVGPLSKLWREARKEKTLPTPDATAAALKAVGYRKLTFDPKAKSLTMAVPGMRLDFGGIGKGVAADEALAAMKKLGVTPALVAASGDIAAGDPPPGRDSWTVEIAPIATGRPARTVKLANAAVSTSGDLFQFVELGGVRYSHVLDPRTGQPLTGRRSVTVIAPAGIRADALAKAASVLPAERAVKLIDATAAAATYIVVKESDAAAEVVTQSSRFRELSAK